MPAILWLIRSLPGDPHHGGYLRIINLARVVASSRRSYLSILDGDEQSVAQAKALGIFEDVIAFDWPTGQQRIAKFLRLSNIHSRKISNPSHFANVVSGLSKFVSKYDVDTAIGVALSAAEYLDELPCQHENYRRF